MKIIYHIGESVGRETIVKMGIFVENITEIYIDNDYERISLNDIKTVEFVKINGLGTMVKVDYNNTHIFMAVTRIYISIGNGFAITNYFATKRLKDHIEKRINGSL